jgi:type IV secretion system protein VirD4
MRPEQPQCQCLARAQLQHQQANDTLLLMAIGTVVVIGGLVWLVGQVAGLLASGSWPDVPLAEVPRILARLRERPGDPAAAWPANVRDLLPGPLGMYATLAGILATPLALGALTWWLHQPPASPRPPATLAARRRRALPPAAHQGVPMLPPPEHGEAP